MWAQNQRNRSHQEGKLQQGNRGNIREEAQMKPQFDHQARREKGTPHEQIPEGISKEGRRPAIRDQEWETNYEIERRVPHDEIQGTLLNQRLSLPHAQAFHRRPSARSVAFHIRAQELPRAQKHGFHPRVFDFYKTDERRNVPENQLEKPTRVEKSRFLKSFFNFLFGLE